MNLIYSQANMNEKNLHILSNIFEVTRKLYSYIIKDLKELFNIKNLDKVCSNKEILDESLAYDREQNWPLDRVREWVTKSTEKNNELKDELKKLNSNYEDWIVKNEEIYNGNVTYTDQ